MRKKFKKRYIVIPLLCIILVGGVTSAGMYKNYLDSFAKVVSVTEIEEYLGYDELSIYGTLKEGTVQNVIINETLKVDETKVKKGDTVKKGDVLLTYDTKSLELNVEEAKNKVTSIENEEKIANNELDVLKKLIPSENAPSDNEPAAQPDDEPAQTGDTPETENTSAFEYTKELSNSVEPLDGDGSKENPFVFFVTSDSVVLKDYLRFLSGDIDSESGDNAEPKRSEAKYALLHVCDLNGTVLYSRLLDGTKITEDDFADWECGSGITLTEDGCLYVDSQQPKFASIITYLPYDFSGDIDTDIDDMFIDDSYLDADYDLPSYDNISQNSSPSDEITLNDNYVYTRDELKQMISDKEAEIKQLGFDKKQAEIDLEKAEKLLETGSETAKMNGTVTFVASSNKKLSESGAYIVVTSNEGVSVKGSISEFQLDQISVGTVVDVMSNSDGSMYSGEITYISDTPSSSSDYYDDGTSSYYEFTANVEGDPSFKEDEGVMISLSQEIVETPLCVELAFIREENGSYYVMVANEDNVIEKRYVKTGKIYYGYAIEVIAGLSEEDRIALPYGKIYEGMPVTDVEYEDLYGFFF